jgi:hypothetical protein
MDRTTRGLLAGIIAGVAMNAWNLIDFYMLHITEIRFLDWFAVLVSLSKPAGAAQEIVALILHIIVWDGSLGVLFTHLVTFTTSQGIIYKSTLYAALLWFLFKVVVNFYRVPVLSGLQPFSGALSNFMAVLLWGIIMGIVLKGFEKKYRV